MTFDKFLYRLAFVLELVINGSFVVLYSTSRWWKSPALIPANIVEKVLDFGVYVVPVVLGIVVIANLLHSKSLESFFRKHIFSLMVVTPLFISYGDKEFTLLLAAAHLVSSILSLYDGSAEPIKDLIHDEEEGEDRNQKRSIYNLIVGITLSPAQLVLISFIAVILLGTFLLMLPFASAVGKSLSFIDALFMATSATCVTGLSTVSIGTELSFFGQAVILALIQIGGLSIMTLYSSMVILLGRTMGMKDRVVLQDLLDVGSLEELFAMIVNIIKYTFFIELWGGIVLTIGFIFEGFEFGKAIYYGFFHSVSAFCNAGFSLFDTSLESYDTNIMLNGTIGLLIVLGGLGFIVLRELVDVASRKKQLLNLTLHSKVVIITSGVLTVLGAVFIFFSEYLGALDSYNFFQKIQVSLFQSITLRTAGFNTLPLGNLHSYTIIMMTLFMFIGASPGSTGGGIKTTSLAILVQSIISTLKGRKNVTILDRRISEAIIVRTTAITFISLIIVSSFILIMMKFEPEQSFLTIFFEVISASGTVGLSLGITPELSLLGKIAISTAMFIGRIGPLTLVLAIGQRNVKLGKYELPEGRMLIG
ncbi:MAG: TrkH family potassium uptake protein [Bacteriovoracaceae bacterium]